MEIPDVELVVQGAAAADTQKVGGEEDEDDLCTGVKGTKAGGWRCNPATAPKCTAQLLLPGQDGPNNTRTSWCCSPCLLPHFLLPTLPKDIVDSQGRGCVFPFGRVLQQSQDALFGPEGEA